GDQRHELRVLFGVREGGENRDLRDVAEPHHRVANPSRLHHRRAPSAKLISARARHGIRSNEPSVLERARESRSIVGKGGGRFSGRKELEPERSRQTNVLSVSRSVFGRFSI